MKNYIYFSIFNFGAGALSFKFLKYVDTLNHTDSRRKKIVRVFSEEILVFYLMFDEILPDITFF